MPKTTKPKPSPAGTASASAGIFTPATKKLRTGKRPAGAANNNTNNNYVKTLDVGTYEGLKKREKSGDKLEHDHIPSSAALKRAEENRLGRKLTPKEARDLHNRAAAIEIPRTVHVKSNTYGGKNTQSRINTDASDLSAAAKRDYATNRQHLINEGLPVKDVDAAIDKMKALNKLRGIQ